MHFRPMFSCFYVFSLGTALLYRTAVRAATMYAQNGGKAFAQAPAAVSSLRKAGMKSLYSNFTNRINMPKIPFTALATPGKIGKYSVQSLATDFSKASHYAFSSERTLVFYSVGSRLYAYDYNPGHERVQDLGDWGGEITMLKFNIQGCYEESVRPWTAHKETINDLYIATYNTPDGGRLRKLTVGINPDVIEVTSDPKADWTGLGKIVNMDWRND